jgi:subtilase family serine protease
MYSPAVLLGRLARTRRSRVCFLTGVAALALTCSATAVVVQDALKDRGDPSTATPTRLAPTSRAEQVSFSLALRLPGSSTLDRYLRDAHDAASPRFRQFLDPTEFGIRFGLPESELQRVEGILSTHGMEVVQRFPQRTALEVRGSAAAVDQLFGTELYDYRDPINGERFHRPSRDAVVPSALRSAVTAVAGLDNRPFRSAQGSPASGALSGLTPAEIARAYEITPLHQAGMTGTGQFVAVVSFSDVREDDIAEWRRQMGVTAKAAEQIVVAGRAPKLDQNTAEVLLDIEAIHAVAPGAQVLNFKAANPTPFGTIVDAIVADGRARIASISWGGCETSTRSGAAERLRDQNAFRAAAAAGINIVASSGDSGAYGCRHQDMGDLRVASTWPAGSPYVLAVGGTYLQRRTDGTWFNEFAMEEPLHAWATGGGLNPSDPRPDWQRGPGVDNDHSNGKRQFPDVAAFGDCDSGLHSFGTLFDVNSKARGEARGFPGCGTSLSAPFWAALIALFQQYASQQGAGELGFINPMLYDIAARAPVNTVFHDVVLGGNLLHNASPGWDYATGWGTPIATPLARAIVDYLKAQR